MIVPIMMDLLAINRPNLCGKVVGLDLPARHEQLAVEFQIAHIVATQSVDMIEVVLVREPTVEREIAWDLISDGPIDQLTKQHVVIAKLDSLLLTLLTLDEAIELQGIVLLRGADVVDNQVVMGYLVPLFGVIPEIADVLDKLAGVIDQYIVDGDDPVHAETGIGAFLQPCDASEVQCFLIPIGLCDPAIEARLVAGDGEFAVDGRDVLLTGDDQPGEVFSEMPSLRLVGEEWGEFVQDFLDDRRKLYNSRHGAVLPYIWNHTAIGICRQNAHLTANLSTLQKSS